MAQRPIALDLLVCEQIIIDEDTSDYAGELLLPASGDASAGSTLTFAILAFLTNGSGEMPLEVQIIRLDTDEIVYSRQSTMQFLDPLQEFLFVHRSASFSFPAACVHEVLLQIDHEVVAHRRIRILVPEEEP